MLTAPLSPEMERRARRLPWDAGRRPRVCEVTLHFSCNARCLFCYQDPDILARPGLGVAEAARALARGRRDGCWVACLIGGEPTTHPGLERVARLARGLGYECVKVVSNGLRLADRAFAARLAAAGVNCFNVSIHGATAEVHDALVGVAGAFARAHAALANARFLGAATGVDLVFTRLNYRAFPAYFESLLCEREVDYFNMIYPHLRGAMAAHAGLAVPYAELAPSVRAAMGAFARHGLAALSRVLVNFPPCVLPGYERILADWEDDGAREPLFGPGIGVARLAEMKSGQRRRPSRCGACVYARRCQGVEPEYLNRFGESEFEPLLSRPAPAAVATLF